MSVDEVFSGIDIKDMREEIERLKQQVDLINAMAPDNSQFPRGSISDAPLELLNLLTELYDLAKAQIGGERSVKAFSFTDSLKPSVDHRTFLQTVDKRRFQHLVGELTLKASNTSSPTLLRLLYKYHQILLSKQRSVAVSVNLDGSITNEWLVS